MKKFFIGLFTILLVTFVGHDIYIRIQDSHKPTIVFVKKNLRTVATGEYNPYQYVIKANDYKGNDINDKKHLKVVKVRRTDKTLKVYFKLTDDMGNKTNKSLNLKLVKIKNHAPNGVLNGKKESSEKKENKTFYTSDFDNSTIRTQAEADNYGATSSQEYTVNPVMNDDGSIKGYECVFKN